MKSFIRHFLLFVPIVAAFHPIGMNAQTRSIGAGSFILDDTHGNTITLVTPSGMSGNYIYTFPPSPGGSITSGYVAMGTAIGQVLYWNGNYWTPSNTGSVNQVLTLNGSGIPIWSSVSGTGTVTSIDVSGGATGLTTSGGPITTSGMITLGGTLALANGGTGATMQAGAINNLLPSQAGNSGKVLQTDGTNVSWQATSGLGTVTSVALAAPAEFTVSGSPITASGTLTLTKVNQNANTFFAGPTSGGSAQPGFRTLVSADIPNNGANTTGTASNVTGTVAISNGGTGQATQQAAIDALTGSQSSGAYLRSDGTNATLSAIQAGDIPILNQSTTGTSSNVTGTIAIANGGTGQTSANASLNALLPSQGGNSGKVLETDGSNTSWQSVSGSGTVTSVNVSGGTTGLTTSGGPITTSGTITLSGTLASANGGTGLTASGNTGNYLRSNGSVWTSSAIQAGDVPILNQSTTGTSANVTGTVAIANGGTGQTTQQAAINALTGSQSSGKYLRSDGTNATLSSIQVGDVPTLNQNTTGTASNVTGTVAIANGGTGEVSQQAAINVLTGSQSSGKYLRSDGTNATLSSIQVGDVPTLNQSTTGTASNVTGTVAIANGGTGQTSANASLNALLPSQGGNSGKVLETDGSNTSWQSVSGSGTVTSVNVSGGTTGLTTSGGPITTSGTIMLSGTLSISNGGTGQTTQQAAINALTGSQSSGEYLRSDGTNATLSSIQVGDVPTLNQSTTGTASNVTGTVAIANGGTGQTTQQAAINALTGSQSSGKYLRSDGTNATLSSIQVGDVPTLNQNTTGSAVSFSGSLGGDVTGTQSATTVAKLQGFAVSSTAPSSGQVLQYNGSNWVPTAPGSGGTVTSVALAAPTEFSVSGSPITTSGTLTISKANENTNTVYAGPSSGSAAQPTFRTLVSADIPNNAANTSGTASNITGTVAITNGGTGATSQSGAINNLLPSQGGNNGKFLETDGSNASWQTVSGSGTVTNVALAAPPEFSVSGSPITTSGTLTISKANENANTVYAGPSSGSAAQPGFRALVSADIPNNGASTTGTASNVSGTVAVGNGGTNLTGYTTGDILYASGSSTLSKLSVGSNPDGYVLTLSGGVPTWQSSGGGGGGWGLTGNAISTGNFLGTTNTQDLVFKTNSTERARITSSGNMGIGTSSPANALEVSNGNIAITNSNNTAGELRMSEPSSHGTHYTSFKAQNQNASVTYTLPAAGSSTAGDVLTNNGSNTLSWAQPIPPGMVVTFNSDSNHAGFTYLATSTITTSSGAWVQDSSMDSDLYELCAIGIGGKLYTIGGYENDSSYPSNELAAYDTATGSWTQKSGMNEARYDFTGVALNGKIYAIQGYNDNDGVLDSLEVYDTGTDTWTIKTSAPNYDYETAAAAGSDGKIYVMGGDYNPSAFLQYDPGSDSWTTLTNLTDAQSRYGAAAVAIDSFIYLIGGYSENYPYYLTRVDVYNVNSGVWTTAASMHDSRYGFQAAVVNRHIYVAGNDGGTAYGTPNAEAYDPSTNTWTSIIPSPDAIEYQPGLAAVGSNVFMAGGYDYSTGYYNSVFELTPPTYVYLNYFSKN